MGAEAGVAPLEELKGIIRKTIEVRRVTLGVFLAIALAIKLFVGLSFDAALLVAPSAWFLLTFPFQYLMEKQKGAQTIHKIHTGFFFLELLLITYFIHLLEGVEWIGVIFYLFTVIYANFFLPRAFSLLITATAIALYGALVFLEYLGWLPHRTLFTSRGYSSLSYVVISFLGGAAGLYATLAYTIQIFAELLRARERELMKLSRSLFSAQEAERRRIAQKLHDEIGQNLVALKLLLPPQKKASQLLDEALAQIRSLSRELRPALLDELGLLPALRQLMERYERATGIKVHLRAQNLDADLHGSPIETMLYRAVCECLDNIRRHAQARSVRLLLQSSSSSVQLVIRDDGIGFNAQEALKRSEGLGLRGLQEQTRLLGGSFRISSRPGLGTKIEIAFGRRYGDSGAFG